MTGRRWDQFTVNPSSPGSFVAVGKLLCSCDVNKKLAHFFKVGILLFLILQDFPLSSNNFHRFIVNAVHVLC